MTKQIAYEDERSVVFLGNNLDVLRDIPSNSIDAVVTDPPYGLGDIDRHAVVAITEWAQGNRSFVPVKGRGFMGMEWDKFVPPPALWDECFRVLKPGGHLLSFAGTRTQDLMGISIRFAGFDIRDGIAWVQSSGFPKSMDVSKAIDKHLGQEREVVGRKLSVSLVERGYTKDYETRAADTGYGTKGTFGLGVDVTAPSSEEAKRWKGWGTAMKPSFEPIIVARKPLGEKNVAENVMKWGVGAVNIDATRIGSQEYDENGTPLGRWTPNFALSHTDRCEVVGAVKTELVRNATEEWTAFGQMEKPAYTSQSFSLSSDVYECADGCAVSELFGYSNPGESQTTSKYFPAFMYHKKASKREKPRVDDETHVSVKPLELMQWLVKLVTPSGGVVLDPFVGSGTTVAAARLEGVRSIGIDESEFSVALTLERINQEN